MSSLTLSLHGAVCRIETGWDGFLAYTGAFLDGLLEPAAGEAPDVTVQLHRTAPPAEEWSRAGVRRWGRRLVQAGPRLLQTEVTPLPGLQLAAGWTGERLELDAYYPARKPSGPLAWLERLGYRPRGDHEAALFTALAYYLVYFPLFYILEQARGWQLLHAAAVSHPAGDILLAGLPGSGKSTFALAWLAQPQARLLSDNLLLTDGRLVYACPEPLHLSAASQALLPPEVQGRLQDTGRSFSYGRSDTRLPQAARGRQARPEALFFLGLGEELSCRPLPPRAALERLTSFDQMAREIQAYAQFAAALDLVSPRSGRAERGRDALAGLLAQMDAYELWLAQDQPLEPATQLAAGMLDAGMRLSESEAAPEAGGAA